MNFDGSHIQWSCDVCGCCCRAIGKLIVSASALLQEHEEDDLHPVVEELAAFPFDINQDGSCSQLYNGICKVYMTRPLICRTDEMYNKYWRDVMTREEWYKQSKETCNKLQKRYKYGQYSDGNREYYGRSLRHSNRVDSTTS